MTNNSWKIFRGTPEQPHNGIERLPEPPSWRNFEKKEPGKTYQTRPEEIELVNAALYLRRPLLVTGKPGRGKTSLAYAVAQELQLGEVLRWNITTRSHLQQGLYSYDAIGRLQDAQGSGKDNLMEIGKYIQLGPLGTALLSSTKPRVLLIDEMDKSDIDLPNDLLTIFEEGEFEIPELTRLGEQFPDSDSDSGILVKTWDNQKTTIHSGKVTCKAFPFVILTSNGEKAFPPAFLRRCLRLDLREPSPKELEAIVKAHLEVEDIIEKAEPIIETFIERRKKGDLATDQLLNAIYMLTKTVNTEDAPMGNSQDEDKDQKKAKLIDQLLRYLSSI
ncbi:MULTISPECIES: ATP-binding protein [unclassified Moorena]|uniref:AAA family ATPase n=1 Tax=unclassified Moorena TaxID=2683338 RepID=UPI0014019B40|nr:MULTISPECIES: ATP-binding protein [unclassified Moorena]NEO14317.1 AAA family ATPase [Moorena sp. SIO3E8]NEQ00392.1 AAA family ATPase [Moorena sp. SIO3F7]